MTRQGRCVLRPDESGRILDRLAGLEKIIAPSLIRQVLFSTNRCNERACTLTHEVMMWVVMAMGILTDLPIREVFRQARRLRTDEDTPHRSSLCVARQRLGAAPLRRLFQEAVRPLRRSIRRERFTAVCV
jgi:Insertion element 4 transposase N-terminal